MGKYRVTGPRPVLDVEPGQEFTRDLTPAEEADLLAAGRVALVPRRYQVVGASAVGGTAPGGVFTAAYTAGQEAALLDGHIELLPDPAPRPAPKPKED